MTVAQSAIAPGPESFLRGLPYLLDMASAHWNARLAERLRSVGLSFEQWRLLLVTAERPPMTIRNLSDATLVPHSTIGRWIAAMERQGWLSRSADPDDSRAVRIGITRAGKRLYARTAPLAAEVFEEGVASLSAEDLAQLQGLLHRLLANLD
jgi:DNA-binding MarR family transcriptional regulator